jgi:FtsP/CotA-like multicopper oxidase with cupredoxin domain
VSLVSNDVNRRRLLGLLGVAGVGATATALAPTFTQEPAAFAYASSEHEHESTSDTTSSNQDEMTWEEMDEHHKAGVLAFPAETAGKGGILLEPEMDGDVKVFNLTCDVIQWEHSPGLTVEAWAYNSMVPGPEIRVTEGDKIRVVVTNNMQQSTAVHFHGLMVPNSQDGVPFITQDPITPGATFTYEFTVKEGNAGAHMYHSHHNSTKQVTMGLLGAFIVEPKDPASRPAHDLDYTMILGDGPIGGFHINGKGFPATEPVVCPIGKTLLVRFMNEGLMIHPMHLHGFPMQVIAQDGWLLPQPYFCDTLNVAPGQRFEVLITPDELGVWAFHCHILSHAESEDGMFGMVTALVVTE